MSIRDRYLFIIKKVVGIKARSLKSGDVDDLLRLTEAEDWLCDRREFEIYRRLNLAMGLVIVDGYRVNGCVTAFAHSRQAWIGNIIVHPELRGRGLGTALLGRGLKPDIKFNRILATASLGAKG